MAVEARRWYWAGRMGLCGLVSAKRGGGYVQLVAGLLRLMLNASEEGLFTAFRGLLLSPIR